MMQSSQTNIAKILADSSTRQKIAEQIEEAVKDGGFTYLEATTQWLEESGIPESQYVKYIPEQIVQNIKLESIEDNLFRPSMSKSFECATLEFMYDS